LTGGANLAVSQGRLVVAGYDKLMVFGPPTEGAAKPAAASNLSDAGRTGRSSERWKIK
jgi:hypothetical protein